MTRHLNVGGRQGRGDPPLAHMDQDQGPGLLASRAFWIGGALCVGFWIFVAWVLA